MKKIILTLLIIFSK